MAIQEGTDKGVEVDFSLVKASIIKDFRENVNPEENIFRRGTVASLSSMGELLDYTNTHGLAFDRDELTEIDETSSALLMKVISDNYGMSQEDIIAAKGHLVKIKGGIQTYRNNLMESSLT